MDLVLTLSEHANSFFNDGTSKTVFKGYSIYNSNRSHIKNYLNVQILRKKPTSLMKYPASSSLFCPCLVLDCTNGHISHPSVSIYSIQTCKKVQIH